MPRFCPWTRSGHTGHEAQSHAHHHTLESDSGRKCGQGPGAGRRRPLTKRPPGPHTSGPPGAELERDTPKAPLRGNGQPGSRQGTGQLPGGGNAPKAVSLSLPRWVYVEFTSVSTSASSNMRPATVQHLHGAGLRFLFRAIASGGQGRTALNPTLSRRQVTCTARAACPDVRRYKIHKNPSLIHQVCVLFILSLVSEKDWRQ